MTVTEMLRDLAAQASPHAPDRRPDHPVRPGHTTRPEHPAQPGHLVRSARPDRPDPGEPASPPYPMYWLVGGWNGAEPDEIGRGILERAIYVSPLANHADHQAAVEIITDALCRWAHPDDIRWCHLPGGGTGGYTVVGRAIRSVSQGGGDPPDEDDLY